MTDRTNPMSVWVSQVMGRQVEVPFPRSIDDLLVDRGQNRFLHLNVDLPESVDVHERVALRDGDPALTAEIYVPRGAVRLPVLLFSHGGAWFKGSAEDERKLGMQIAEAGMVVVNLDYALAPEHPFPAGLDDLVEAADWIASNIVEFGGDPALIALAGASAGANLSAAATGLLTSRANPIPIRALVLLYGIFDLRVMADIPGPSPLFEAYLGDAWRDRLADPRVSPINANLALFPPTYVSCGSEDEGLGLSLAMVGALAGSGNPVTASVVADANHVFLNIPDVVRGAAPELQRITAWLLDQLAP